MRCDFAGGWASVDGGQLLDVLKETAPRATKVGLLRDAANPGSMAGDQIIQIGQRLGLHVIVGDVRSSDDLDAAFAKLAREGAQMLVVASTPALVHHASRVAEFAMKRRLPAISSSPRMAEAGLLLYYGTHWPEIFGRAADHVDRVLKGARPADIPVEQAGRFELVVNLKTAKEIGVSIPRSIVVRADRLVE